MNGAGVNEARTRPEFRHLQPVARVRARPETEVPAQPMRAPPLGISADVADYGPSAMPFHALNLFPLATRGVQGSGITIAMLDTGFETENPAFDSASVIAQWDFIFNDSIVRNEPGDVTTQSRHGTETWSLLAANVTGQIIGIAPNADYILAKTEDERSETRVEEDNWVAAIEWADSIGVDVVSSSVGYTSFEDGFAYAPEDYNGDVAVTTVAADSAAALGILVVNAAGNDGPAFRSLITPADGDSVLSAGAEDSLGILAGFSSRGPTADGRLKPDLTAPGVSVFVVNPLSGTGYSRVNGTSFSAPILAGAGALLREVHPTFTGVEVIEALRRAGNNRDQPDSTRGWGRPDGSAAAFFPFGIVPTSPIDSVLAEVTPTFMWSAPSQPLMAQPVEYRLVVARDSLLTDVVLDTAPVQSPVVLPVAQETDTKLWYAITGVAVDSVTWETGPIGEFTVPAWVELIAPDDPGGVTIRDPRPRFEWRSPGVSSPPGPFAYDLEITRADDGVLEHEARGLVGTDYTVTRDLERNTPYRWSVTARIGNGSYVAESQGTFVIIDDSAPSATLLFQNFPNPFPNQATDATCIWFDLARSGSVTLDVLDVRGHVVLNIVPGTQFGQTLEAGRYGRPDVGGTGTCDPRIAWNGRASDGTFVPQGVYLIRLHTPDGTYFKRAVFMGVGN